jgi:hypothetical protein
VTYGGKYEASITRYMRHTPRANIGLRPSETISVRPAGRRAFRFSALQYTIAPMTISDLCLPICAGCLIFIAMEVKYIRDYLGRDWMDIAREFSNPDPEKRQWEVLRAMSRIRTRSGY